MLDTLLFSRTLLPLSLKLSLAIPLASFLFLIQVALIHADGPGDLDLSFNGSGIVTTTVTGIVRDPWSLIIQPDNKFLVVGVTDQYHLDAKIALARYTSQGQLDLAFNSSGIVTTSVGTVSTAFAAALTSDQKIVVAGESDDYFNVVRYLPNGSLDTSFNGAGFVTTSLSSGPDTALALRLRPDDTPVAGGPIGLPGIRYFGLAHYTNEGELDATINNTGLITGPLNIPPSSYILGMSFQPDGKLLTWGVVDTPFTPATYIYVARHTTLGEPDLTFNSTGLVTTTFGHELYRIYDLATQPDGKVILTGLAGKPGYHPSELMVVRYLPEGKLDPTFNGTGIVTTGVVGTSLAGGGVSLQPDGKIVVGGVATREGENVADALVVRYTSSGILDTTFKGTGIVTTPIEGGISPNLRVAIQPDGKIILVSNYSEPVTNKSGLFIARYLGGEQSTPIPALTITKHANVAFAEVGQQITYTYRITNTGDITLTGLIAEDDRLGPVPLTTTTLVPEAGLEAFLTATATNPTAPLTNTVIVTGSAAGHSLVTATATAMVVVQDTLPPVFPAAALITPTKRISLTQLRPRFLWRAATDNDAVLSYTLLLTGPGLTLQTTQTFTTTQPAYTPTADLSPGPYTWTVQARDLAGNITTVAPPARFVIAAPDQRVYLPALVKGQGGPK